MGKRICTSCNKKFPDKKFEENTNPKGIYFRSTCITCKNELANKKKSSSPEKFIRHLYTQLKYSRKKKNPEFGWDIEPEHLIERWEEQKGRCALTNIVMTYAKDGSGKKEFNVSIDRINPLIGYIPSNMQLVCQRVNYMKHVLPEEELYWWCKNIVTNKEDI